MGSGQWTVNSQQSTVDAAARAFVEAMGELGNYYFWQYEGGNRDVIGVLGAEEANLLHARQMARENGWWNALTSTMQGLHSLYDHTGRRAEWARLVNEIVPDFVDPATDGPLAGREEEWRLVIEYRARLAMEARQWADAERLQSVCVEWDRQRATPALAVTPEKLDNAQKNVIRSLAASLVQMGDIQREQSKRECAQTYQEAIPFLQRIGDKPAQAVTALNLGHAYKNIPTLRDLVQAERWYRRSLELFDERDKKGRGACLSQLGYISWERFKDARTAKQPEQELLRYLNDAVQFYQQALAFDPPDALDDLAVDNNQLGNIYYDAGDIDRALPHYRESIRYEEMQGNLYGAATTRFNVAIALAQSGRLADAREYALAALRNYESFGDRAAEEIEGTKRLVREIERLMKGGVV